MTGRESGNSIEGISVSQTIKEQRDFFAGAGDTKAYYWAESLRKEAESLHGWQQLKEKAKREIGELPPDIFPQIFKRVEPYLDAMPAGHSKGHVKRDFITSMLLVRDPDNSNLDDVEKLVGIFGGTFHDIGNSVINRYQENERFAGHAEVGAYLFGEITKDLIPQNLLKMIQYSIASHTNYRRDIPVTKKDDGHEVTLTKRVYEDEIVAGNERKGLLLTRMADRLDGQGIIHLIRHAIVKVEPVADYDPNEMKFHAVKDDEKADFVHQFMPVLRTPEQRKELPPQEATTNILEHTKIYRDNALTPNEHNRGHSDYFTNDLVKPAIEERDQLVNAVLDPNPNITDQQVGEGFNKFYKACEIVEPGIDINAVIEMFKDKFTLLSPEVKKHWANGFRLLPDLYNRWYKRIEGELSKGFVSDIDPQMKAVFENGNEFAKQMLRDFKWTQ